MDGGGQTGYVAANLRAPPPIDERLSQRRRSSRAPLPRLQLPGRRRPARAQHAAQRRRLALPAFGLSAGSCRPRTIPTLNRIRGDAEYRPERADLRRRLSPQRGHRARQVFGSYGTTSCATRPAENYRVSLQPGRRQERRPAPPARLPAAKESIDRDRLLLHRRLQGHADRQHGRLGPVHHLRHATARKVSTPGNSLQRGPLLRHPRR